MASALAQPALPKSLRDVGFDQKLDAQVPLDLEFNDETGRVVKLGYYFGDKPVVLVLAYFRWRFFQDRFVRALGIVTFAGVLIAATSAGLGSLLGAPVSG